MARDAAGHDRAGPVGAGIAAGNARQAQAWNGDDGQYWTRQCERHEAMYRHLTPELMAAAAIRPGDRVLDVGCGSGGTALAAAGRTGPLGTVLGVDLSAPLLGRARERAAARGLAQVTFTQTDAQVQPFAAGGFEVALSRFGVMFFADPAAAFGNIARALRPGGRLAFLCWRELRENAYLSVPFAAVAPYLPLPDPGAPGSPGPFSLAEPERLRELLTGAAFGDLNITALDVPMPLGSDPDDVAGYQLGLPMVRAMLAGAGREARDGARAALRAALAEHQGPEGVTLGCAAWLVTARRS